MFALIAGCGKLGSGLARLLSSQGHDVVIVDQDIDQRRLGGEFDGLAGQGIPTDPTVLEEAGIRKAGLFVAATQDDRVNAMAAQVARELFGVPAVLARIMDPELEAFYRGLGLDTVCPTSTAINQILDLIREDNFSSLRGSIDPDLIGLRPPREWIGKALGEIEAPAGKRIAGVVDAASRPGSEPGRAIRGDDLVLLRRIRAEGDRA